MGRGSADTSQTGGRTLIGSNQRGRVARLRGQVREGRDARHAQAAARFGDDHLFRLAVCRALEDSYARPAQRSYARMLINQMLKGVAAADLPAMPDMPHFDLPPVREDIVAYLTGPADYGRLMTARTRPVFDVAVGLGGDGATFRACDLKAASPTGRGPTGQSLLLRAHLIKPPADAQIPGRLQLTPLGRFLADFLDGTTQGLIAGAQP